MMTIPEPWQHIPTMSREKRAFYQYYATMMEPWDGPASIIFSDGDIMGAVLDRNGLRPSRYYVTDDGCLILSSEVGALDDIPAELLSVLGRTHSERINSMVTSVIEASWDRDAIAMTPEIGEATMKLRAFLKRNVYTDSIAKAEEHKAQDLLISLYQYYVDHPDGLPELYRRNIERDGIGRCACDFVSGMTDRYAIAQYEDVFIPKVWKGNP